jgi:hypothetical protein
VLLEGRGIDTGDFTFGLKVNAGDPESVRSPFDRHTSRRGETDRGMSGFRQRESQCHRETSGVSCSE